MGVNRIREIWTRISRDKPVYSHLILLRGNVLFYKNIGHVTFTEAEDGALQVEDYKLKIKSLGIDVSVGNVLSYSK